MMKTMNYTTKWTKTLAVASLASILMVSASGISSAHVHSSGNGQIMATNLATKMVTSKKLESSEK